MTETYDEARKDLDERVEQLAGMTLDTLETEEYLVYDKENGKAWLQSDEFYRLDEMA